MATLYRQEINVHDACSKREGQQNVTGNTHEKPLLVDPLPARLTRGARPGPLVSSQAVLQSGNANGRVARETGPSGVARLKLIR